MSRSLTAGMITEVTAGSLRPVLLCRAAFDGGNLDIWNGLGSLTWNSITFTGAGTLLSMTEIKESLGVEANGASFQLNGIPSSIISTVLTEDYQGRYVTVWFACLDSSGAIVADPYQLFKGRMDVIAINEGGDTVTLTLRAENKLIDMQRVKVKRFTDEDQHTVYPSDDGLEFVAQMQDKEIVWGQKS